MTYVMVVLSKNFIATILVIYYRIYDVTVT